MNIRAIAYWTTTSLIALETLGGGTTDLLRGGTMLVAGKPVLEVIRTLGYPEYFLNILGVWKLLGGAALLAPRSPRLKEWAYAGIFFELTGAAASHAAHGDDTNEMLAPLCLALLAVASWALRPQSRILGTILPE